MMSVDENTAKAIEADGRRKYNGAFYQTATIMRPVHQITAEAPPHLDYFARLDRLKLGLARKYLSGRIPILDLCCATAEYLHALAGDIHYGVGLDFTIPFLQRAGENARLLGKSNIGFLCGNARQLPLANHSVGLLYCFSALYTIPRVEEALREMGRILKPGGIAVFDMGNLWSLNTLICRAHQGIATPCHIPVSHMKRFIAQAGLEILEHRSLQILPLWGNRPRWARFLLHPIWKSLLATPLAGRMLDEWICSIPGIRRLAFRHIFVCRKRESAP